MNKIVLLFHLSILITSCHIKLLETDFKEPSLKQEKVKTAKKFVKIHNYKDKIWDLYHVSFSGDYNGEIKFNTNFDDLFSFPNTITVKKNNQKLTYLQRDCFITNPVLSCIPRLIKKQLNKNQRRHAFQVTYRLINKSTSTQKTSNFFWATFNKGCFYNGKLNIDSDRELITRLKVHEFPKFYNYKEESSTSKTKSLFPKYDKSCLINSKSKANTWNQQNKIFDNSDIAHSITSRTEGDDINTYSLNHKTEYLTRSKDCVLSPARECAKMLIIENFFAFYFTENHKRDQKLAPIINKIIDYSYSKKNLNFNTIPYRQVCKFTDLETGEIQTAETSVKEIIEDRKGRKYPHRIDVIQKNANGDILTKYSITYQYMSVSNFP